MKKVLLVFVIIIIFLVACSPTVQTSLSTDDTLPPTLTSIATEAPTGSTPMGTYPSETADLKLFTNTDDGYCLLYPAEFTSNPCQPPKLSTSHK
jgi:hypothetical protein